MEYENVRDFCGRPTKRLVLKSLKPGDKVYRYDGYSAYMPCEVAKVTPTGQVTVTFTYGGPSIFFPTGRERGAGKYEGACLDVDMPFDNRTEWLAARERIKAARLALRQIEVGRTDEHSDKASLTAEVNRLQGLLDAVRALVEAI